MILKGIASSTEIDTQGEQVTKECLIELAEMINGPYALPLTVEHNPLTPPVGKVLNGRIISDPENIFSLEDEIEIFEKESMITLPDGTTFVKQESATDTRPIYVLSDAHDKSLIVTDHHDFDTAVDMSTLLMPAEMDENDCMFETQHLVRKSITNISTIVIIAGATVIAYISKRILGKVIDRIIDPLLDELERHYKIFSSLPTRLAKHLRHKNGQCIYTFYFPGKPCIEFVVVTDKPDSVESAMQIQNLIAPFQCIDTLKTHFRIDKIQFKLNGDKEWQFNFLLTAEGAVVGTERTMKTDERRPENLLAKGHLSIGGTHAGEPPI